MMNESERQDYLDTIIEQCSRHLDAYTDENNLKLNVLSVMMGNNRVHTNMPAETIFDVGVDILSGISYICNESIAKRH